MSNNAANTATSGLPSSERTKFLHIVMSYDTVEGKYSYQTLDNHALRHQPCTSPTCDFDSTLRAWQALPRSVKLAASGWVDDNFSYRVWHLHAASPIQKDTRTTRRLLQKAVLGAVAHRGMASIMLVFCSTQKYLTSETGGVTTTGDSMSDSHTGSRIELSQTDVEQMREWLTTKGLSTAKIAELESLVVKQKESAAASAATQTPLPQDQGFAVDENTGHEPTDATVQVGLGRHGARSHVRFATGDAAPSTRQKSEANTNGSRVGNTYDRGYVEHISRQPEPYGPSRAHEGPGQEYRYVLPPPPPPLRTWTPPFNDPHAFNPWPPYNHIPHESAFNAPRFPSDYAPEPNRTRTEDEWEDRDRRPQGYPQRHGYNTIPDPNYQKHGYPTQSTDYPPPPVDLTSGVQNPFLPGSQNPFLPRPVPVNYRDDRNRDLSSRVADLERQKRSHEYVEPKGRGRSLDDGNAHTNAEARRETSPHPYRIVEREPQRRMPTSQAMQEGSYNDSGRHQRKYSELMHTPRVVVPDTLSIPRQPTPETVADDAEDAEDATLDDAELKNKMLVKYTGGTVANIPAAPDRTGDKPRGFDTEDDARVASDNAAGAGAEPKETVVIDEWGPDVETKKKKKKKKKNKAAWLEPEPEPNPEPVSPIEEKEDDGSWGDWGPVKKKKKKKKVVRLEPEPESEIEVPPPPPEPEEPAEDDAWGFGAVTKKKKVRKGKAEPESEPLPEPIVAPPHPEPEPPAGDGWGGWGGGWGRFDISAKDKKKAKKKGTPLFEPEPEPTPEPPTPPEAEVSVVEPASLDDEDIQRSLQAIRYEREKKKKGTWLEPEPEVSVVEPASLDDKDIQRSLATILNERKKNQKKGAWLDLKPESILSVTESASLGSQSVDPPASTPPVPGVQVSLHHVPGTK
jgi:hypothetical protein